MTLSSTDPAAATAAPPPAAEPADAAEADRSAFSLPLRRLGFGDPLRWLAAGWRDFRAAPGVSL